MGARDATVHRREEGWPAGVRIAAAGVALVLELPPDTLPAVLHWGADTGPLDEAEIAEITRGSRPPLAANGMDEHHRVAVLPEGWTGWTGTVGLAGHRSGAAWSPRFRPEAVSLSDDGPQGGVVVVDAVDDDTRLALRLRIELLPSGLVRVRAGVTNLADAEYTVDALTLALPVPTRADEVHDLAGRWAKERMPQQRPFTVGAHVREGRHGRTGADAATLLIAAVRGLDFDRGEAWGMHVAFSGNHRVIAERAYSGERLLLGGELLLPGEIELRTGETYESPAIYAAYGIGHDALAARFHEHLRARAQHPRSPRPVVMNVWEAVYFDHDLDRITALADLAADAGVERFVLDDGWFGSRRDDTSGLGDWVLSDAWRDGRLAELVAHVRARGMQFGLWFEPEMVNLDSDLARAHPEWILRVPGRLPQEARHQQVLDVAHPGAFAHLRERIISLVSEYGIDFVKWDHNRDLVDAGSTTTGRAGVHDQTLAVYRLLDDIRAACPGLEIESCSSGGARVDLEILERTDRVWASDCIDAHDRWQIQRWTAQLLPPELVGSHVGADRAHTTGRRLDLSFRAATALFGHFGIEWDLTKASPAERAALAEWVGFYKEVRALIHGGAVVRRALEDGDVWLQGAVAPDRGEALYALTVRERPLTWPAGRVRLPGLDPTRRYRVSADGPAAADGLDARVHPAWWTGELVLSGSVLERIGLELPALGPDHAVLVRVTAV